MSNPAIATNADTLQGQLLELLTALNQSDHTLKGYELTFDFDINARYMNISATLPIEIEIIKQEQGNIFSIQATDKYPVLTSQDSATPRIAGISVTIAQ